MLVDWGCAAYRRSSTCIISLSVRMKQAYTLSRTHFMDLVRLDESFLSDSLFATTSATICGQRCL